MRSIKVALGRAQKALDKAQKQVESLKDNKNSFKIEDIYLPLNHLFNAAAKRAFQNKVKTTTVERKLKVIQTTQTKVYDQVRFFGAMAIGERKIFDAAQKVANQINAMADKGFVTGVLTPLIMYQFATEPHQLEQYAIISYVALSPEGIEHLKHNPTKIEFPVGAAPVNSDDL